MGYAATDASEEYRKRIHDRDFDEWKSNILDRVSLEEAQTLGDAKPVPLSDTGLPPPDSPEAIARANRDLQQPGRVAKDIGVGAIQAPRAVVGGMLDAAQEIVDLVTLSEGKFEIPQGPFKERPDDSVTAGVIRDMSQFLTGYFPALKLTEVAGAGLKVMKVPFVKDAIAGAIADFAVWDPREPRFSNFLADHLGDSAAGEITRWMAANEEDSQLKARAKAALEGSVAGVAAAGLFKVLGWLRRMRIAAREAKIAAEAAGGTVEDVVKEAKDAVSAAKQKTLQSSPAPISIEDLTKEVETRLTNADAIAAGISPEEFASWSRAPAEEGDVIHSVLHANEPEDIRNVMTNVVNAVAANIDEARRGKISFEETKRLAEELGMTPESFIARRRGPMMAEEATAARRIRGRWARETHALSVKAAADGATSADIFRFRKALANLFAFETELIGARAEGARSQGAWRIDVDSEGEALADAIRKSIELSGGPQGIQAQARLIAELGNNPAAIMRAARDTKGGSLGWDVLFETWINIGLLTKPASFVANAAGDALASVFAVPTRYIAENLSQVIGDGAIPKGEAAAMAWGYRQQWLDAFRMAGRALLTGEDVGGEYMGLLGKEGPREHAVSSMRINSEALGLKPGSRGAMMVDHMGPAIDMLGSFIRFPGRTLGATDTLFKVLNYHGQLAALAYRKGVAQGLEGEDLARFISGQMDNPDRALKLSSQEFAKELTFQKELGKAGSSGLKYMRDLEDAVPPVRFVMPFKRTLVNLFKFSLKHTPLAIASGKIRRQILEGGPDGMEAVARIGLGSGLMLLTADLAMQGLVTGGRSGVKSVAEANDRLGRQEWSIDIGTMMGRDKPLWVTYDRLDPFGMVLGLSAELAQVWGDLEYDEQESVITAAVVAVAEMFTSKTYMSGVSRFMAAVQEGKRYGDTYLGGIVQSMIPGFVRLGAEIVDPTRREVKGARLERTTVTPEQLKAMMDAGEIPRNLRLVQDGYTFDPKTGNYTLLKEQKDIAEFLYTLTDQIKEKVAAARDLAPRRDLWGNKIEREMPLGVAYYALSPMAAREGSNDPVDVYIRENGVPVSSPSREIRGVRLTPEEYSEYVRLAGEGAKKSLDNLFARGVFDRVSGGPNGSGATIIETQIRAFREVAQAKMMREFPELKARIQTRIAKDAAAKRGAEAR